MGKTGTIDHDQASGVRVINVKMRNRRITHAFHIAAVVYMTIVVLVGFWPSYFGQLFGDVPDRHWVIHLHAMVFTGWLLLLLVQVSLVAGMILDGFLHRKVHPAYPAGFAVLLLSIGRAVIMNTEPWQDFAGMLLRFFM